jgi:hypothetical protein
MKAQLRNQSAGTGIAIREKVLACQCYGKTLFVYIRFVYCIVCGISQIPKIVRLLYAVWCIFVPSVIVSLVTCSWQQKHLLPAPWFWF